MATPIPMPKEGNTVEECILVEWKKKKGDSVNTGDIIAEIETDKATFEIESSATGTMLEIFFKEGDLVPVFDNICVIGKDGEKTEEFRPKKKAPTPAATTAPTKSTQSAPNKKAEAVATTSVVQESTPVIIQEPAKKVASPRARKLADKYGISIENVNGTGPKGRILENDIIDAYHNSTKVSSLASKLIKDENRTVPQKGSGPGGMIVSSDLQPAPEPLSNMRKIIGERMCASLASTAQLTLSNSADATNMLNARKKIKEKLGKPGAVNINLNDMVMKAVIDTLLEFPLLNSEFINGNVQRHKDIDICFACDTPKGLVVPVIKEAQKLSISELSARVKSMSADARDGKISPDDLNGGSFTVTNIGILGIESFTPVLNAPQVAILGVCAITLKPVRKDGKVVFVEHIGLSLTIDHQVIDGVPGAQFLKSLKEKIENFDIKEEN